MRGNAPLGIAVGIHLWFPGLFFCLLFVGRLPVQRPRHDASLPILGRLRLPKDWQREKQKSPG